MVSFSCESCCDVLVKKKLDQHQSRCPGAQFTCLDCSTTFQGTSYRAHTSCISEAQKYQKGLYRPEKGRGKGGRGGAGAGAANPNLTPLGDKVGGEKVNGEKVEEVKKVEKVEEKVNGEKVENERKRKRKDEDGDEEVSKESKEKKEKKEKKDKKDKKDKKGKKDKKEEKEPENTTSTTSLPIRSIANGTSEKPSQTQSLSERFLESISSKKETSISKIIKKLNSGEDKDKDQDSEVWELLKKAKVRKEEGGKLVLVLP